MTKEDFNNLRLSLTPEDIKDILHKYNVQSVTETSNYIIFPTVCHNAYDGSPKLYYYKNTKLFKCYTQCGSAFTIFSLLKKIHRNRGIEQSIMSHFGGRKFQIGEYKEDELDYLYYLYHDSSLSYNNQSLNKELLNRFKYNLDPLTLWEQEGVTRNTMALYNIGYSEKDNCITIPIFDENGELVSIRGRFLEGKNKYKPIIVDNKLLSCPSSSVLYGCYENEQTIRNNRKIFLFEGEKSVLKLHSAFNKSMSVATLGQNISQKHIELLNWLGVEEVILAYDADYRTREEMHKIIEKYRLIMQPLNNYFHCSIMIDFFQDLNHKDSPIDKGGDVFMKIFEKRIKA